MLPQRNGSVYVFSFPDDGPVMEVDPTVGARISSLKLGNSEFLYIDKSIPHWGSTFWPAPQNAWSRGSNPETLDREPYTGGPEGPVLTLTSDKHDETQLVFVKHFSADDADTSITVTLVMRNGGSEPISWAPWQITRAPPGGLTFFPKGPGESFGNMASEMQEMNGWMWFDMDNANLPGGFPKYFADGEGWMAHAHGNGLLLFETFPDISTDQAAPEEAEIEIYADFNKRYVEMEHQGSYTSIPAGDSIAWTTRWYLRQLPADIPRTPGDSALMAYVLSLANPTTPVRPPRARHTGVTQDPIPLRPAVLYPVPGSRPVDASGRRRR